MDISREWFGGTDLIVHGRVESQTFADNIKNLLNPTTRR